MFPSNSHLYHTPKKPSVIPTLAEASIDHFQDIFEDDETQVELIVKFSGDINAIAAALGVQVEILSQGYAIITIDKTKISDLYAYPQIENTELPKNLYIESSFNLTSSCIRAVQESKAYPLTGSGVIVAILDSGIDYTHMDFRHKDGSSRILYIWDQTGHGSPPAGFSAGTEYRQAQLDEALNSPNPFGLVPFIDTNGHGTAVAGIAAGNGNESNGEQMGVAPEADMIIVKVGRKGYRSFAQTTELMRAVKYAIDKARQRNQAVAINICFGMNNGSHRGDSLFETYLSDMSTEWKNVIVVPTGNEGAAGHHYFTQLLSHQSKEITFFTVAGIDRFYISLWKNFTDSFSVELVFPDGTSSGIIGIENQIKRIQVKNQILTVIYGQPSHYSVSQELFFNVKSISGSISSGVWKLRIMPSKVVEGSIELWLPTLEEVTDKTYFSNPSVNNTMTIPSTALHVIKVSGYNDRLGNIAEFSGEGSVNPALPNPDLAAPAVGILTARAGGGYDSYSGTSMAAPFVTGSAALMMQWGIVNNNDRYLYGERIKAFLRLGAKRAENVRYPNPTFGYGALCLNDTMSYLERYHWGGIQL